MNSIMIGGRLEKWPLRPCCANLMHDGMIREARMGQLGFFDADKRLAALSAKVDPLEAIDRLVPWERFRSDIEAVVLTPDEVKKSSAGRKPVDAIVMFRMLVLQALHNLSDEQAEYQVRDRFSFTRFLRLGIEDSIPDRRRCGCSARSWPRLGWLRSYSSASTSILRRRATWRVAGRWLMPRLCRCRNNAIAVMRTKP